MTNSATTAPLVSLCIPTYNRAERLPKALASALAQDYPNLEIVVVDNASPDGTEAVVAAIHDPRLRYLRNESNIGLIGNINKSIREGRGRYRLWLADDDHIDPNYVSACVAALEADSSVQLVAGTCAYYRDGEPHGTARRVQLLARSPLARVFRYYLTVTDNSTFYGVYRGELFDELAMGDDTISADWQFLASVALHGRVRTLAETTIHREYTGASSNKASYLKTIGRPAIFAYEFYVLVSWEVLADIGWRNRHWRRYPVPVRAVMALGCAGTVLAIKVVARRLVRTLRGLARVLKV